LHVFGRLDRGGAELRTIELAEAFPPERVRSDFLVLSGLDGALDSRVNGAGGHVIKCPIDLRFPGAFLRLLRERRYDVVQSHVHYFSGPVLALARLAGVRTRVAQFHTAIINDRQDTRRRRAQLAICRELLDRSATDIVAVGEGAMCGAWRPGWMADPRCRVIHSGVQPDRLRSVPSGRPGPPVILNVASIQPLKNQLRLVQVMEKLIPRIAGLSLSLIGREVGDYGNRVRRAVEAAGLTDRIRFVGEVDEAMPWIAASQLMILPSLWEGLPCAAVEACAIGVPVLASDLPGTRELSQYFPHLRILPLTASDDEWAAAAAELIVQDVTASKVADCLARSPFAFDRSRDAHYSVWSHSRAMA
jgi:glycosyltransferase involved in cell wall biosynthesis